MKKSLLFFLVLSINIFAQINQEEWINGFSNRIAGENLDYHSCHPGANLALLIRCYNDKDYIEWETDSVPSNYQNKFVTFTWIAGYSTATSSASHTFHLYINEKHFFEFRTSPNDPKADWNINGVDSSILKFKFAKVDQVDDFFGYMSLTVPSNVLSDKRSLRIKIKGDASNSKDWFMTMQYPLVHQIRITPEKVISKDESGKLLQRVKVSIDHFNSPQQVEIFTEGKEVLSSRLNLGMNEFYINFGASEIKTEKSIEIKINGNTTVHRRTINPARNITLYLIPHAHVDIGYTALQTEVEKKHWNNFENAIEYSKRSSSFPNGSVFKWNVEVLWAVKSYLENFPEKRTDFFNAVKNGWIGLDATYVNVMTALCRPEELYRLVDYSNRLEKEIGIKIESAMISDIPGYTWGIVQTFADNGIKYFSVGPNEFDRIGNTLKEWGDKPFYWKSPSGKEKVLIWLAGKGYSWFHRWRLTRDDFSPLAKYLDELDAENYPYDIVHMRYNIGGDNGFPDSTLADFVKNWNETHVTPKFKISTNAEMFRDFEAKYKKVIPTYSSDFTPYWEDGAGSTAKETAMNRNTAELLTQLETLYTISKRDSFPFQEFDEGWKYVLLFSEHTWGAWNSTSDPETKFVTDQWDIKKSYAIKADSIARKLHREFIFSKSNIDSFIDSFSVYNSSSWKRSDIVTIPSAIKTISDFVIDDSGKQISTQRLSNGDLVFVARNIPALSKKHFRFVKNDPSQISSYNPDPDENRWMKKVLTDEIASFIDKKNLYGLNGFIHTGQNAMNPKPSGFPKVAAKEKGLVENSVQFESTAPGCNKLLWEVKTFDGLNKTEIVNIIDKAKGYEKENIRFAFPFNIENPTTRIDLAWSVIQPEKNQLPGANKNYFIVQRWIDISNDKRGITLATIDAPFVEVGGMNAESWMSSPDKVWSKHASSSSKIYSWAMNNSWHTNFKASQEGISTFKYFLKPHKAFDYLDAYKFGVEQTQPLQAVYTDTDAIEKLPIIQLDEHTSVVITSFRPSRDGKALIMRLYNPTDKSSKTAIKLKRKTEHVFYISNGDEEEIKIIRGPIDLKPFEVMTIKIAMLD